MYNKFRLRKLVMILIFIFPLAAATQAQGDPFSGCGTIWPDTGCYLLDLDNNHDTYYIIDSVDGFDYGQWACVYGTLDTFCDTSCAPSALGCVSVDSLLPDSPPDTTMYMACGILLEGTGCIIFSPVSGPIYEEGFYLLLDNYGTFGIGDTVCVSGNLVYDTIPECPEAVGRLLDNSIDLWVPQNTPFSDCGVLVNEFGCLLFAPFSMGGTYYYLENYGGFGFGDTVCVSGTLIPSCDSGCVGADGCIAGNTIYGWENDGWPYEQCGVLVEGIDCIVFAPFNDSIVLALDYIGDFVIGDTVCISGVVDWGCTLGCTGVAGCILTNNITIRFDFYHNYEIIVKLEEGFTIDPILIDYQGIALDSVVENNLYLVGLGTTYLLESAIDSISARPGVIFAQPNYTVGMPETFHVSQSFPDDQHPTLHWGTMPSTYFDASVYTLNSDSANLYTSGLNVVVAVIDNGVDFSHPLLINSFASNGYDFVDNDNDPSEVEGTLKGHGTFVCGIIRRIAPDCSFIPIRVFDPLGYGNSYMVAEAIRFAVAQSVDVINMSFGNYTSHPVVQEAVNEAVEAGITLVAAVGNAGTSVPSYPSAYPGVIAVSAVDTMEYLADFSNYGEHIDVCAPGVNIYSSLAGEYAGEYEWGTWSGTSFAAPMVTGVCVLILSGRDDLTSFGVEELIHLTAETGLEWGNIIPPSSEYGYGRVDALVPAMDANLGDVNNSQTKNVQDVTYLINMLYYNGPAPIPTEDVGDTDCSDTINLLDIANLIRYLYMGGEAPSCILD